MTDNNAPSENNRPAYEALILVQGESAESNAWHKIGAAWHSKDKRGLNLVLNELPFTPDGSRAIYLRPRKTTQPAAAQPAEAE